MDYIVTISYVNVPILQAVNYSVTRENCLYLSKFRKPTNEVGSAFRTNDGIRFARRLYGKVDLTLINDAKIFLKYTKRKTS